MPSKLTVDTSPKKRARPEDLDANHYSSGGGNRAWVRTGGNTFEARDLPPPTRPSPRHDQLSTHPDYYERHPASPARLSLTPPNSALLHRSHSRPRSPYATPPPPSAMAHSRPHTPYATPPPPSAITPGREYTPYGTPPPHPPSPAVRYQPRPIPSRPQQIPSSSRSRQHSLPPLQRRPAPPSQIERSSSGQPAFASFDGDAYMDGREPAPPPLPPNSVVERLMQRGRGPPALTAWGERVAGRERDANAMDDDKDQKPSQPQMAQDLRPTWRDARSPAPQQAQYHEADDMDVDVSTPPEPQPVPARYPSPARAEEAEMSDDSDIVEISPPPKKPREIDQHVELYPRWETIPGPLKEPPRDPSPMLMAAKPDDRPVKLEEGIEQPSAMMQEKDMREEDLNEKLKTFRLSPNQLVLQSPKATRAPARAKGGFIRNPDPATVPGTQMVGKMDLSIPCPLAGCNTRVLKSSAMMHARHAHGDLARPHADAVCPKCGQALRGENFPKHFVSHFPSYRCPYGCGALMARVTAAERRRHYQSCRSAAPGVAWEEADLAITGGERSVLVFDEWEESDIKRKPAKPRARRSRDAPKAPSVDPEEVDELESEDELPLAKQFELKVRQNKSTKEPDGDRHVNMGVER
ncbi:hypothetical protein PsYK624_051980 [Phanerochaete sordida]|uniref:Uncharacterized protein n=1 Tax=Phanerochaete sordida TaxID=48140 RepID=A0A9P3G6E0_9APHY|nr:hypothetical protein PsYK624_051980 [Phanerochaete sordida]